MALIGPLVPKKQPKMRGEKVEKIDFLRFLRVKLHLDDSVR
jgi:hypothetical protein